MIAYPALKGYVALWGILIALSDLLWLTPWQKRLCGAAAQIQEAFDCDVLSLPWNDLKAGNRPDPELIKEQADRYQSWAAQMPPLADWYAPAVDDLPLHIGRIACQRSNCWWDAKQRRRYAAWVIAILMAVVTLVFLLALHNGLTIEDFVLKVAAPLAPAVLLGVRQFRDQVEAASRLDKLKEHAERLPPGKRFPEGMTNFNLELWVLQDLSKEGKIDLSKIPVNGVIIKVIKDKFAPPKRAATPDRK